MVAYADTGFLVSLYVQETTSPKAIAEVKRLKEPLPLTPLHGLEFRNALHLGVKRGDLTASQRDTILKTLEADRAAGLYRHVPLSSPETYRKAQELSDLYTGKFGTRSLDLLHVASAVLLSTTHFLTFDVRQAQAARAQGMKVKP